MKGETEMMMNTNTIVPLLANCLQQKLDAAVQSPRSKAGSTSGNIAAKYRSHSVVSVIETSAKVHEDDLRNASIGYRDFSRDSVEWTTIRSVANAQSNIAKEPTFPAKLHMILSNHDFQDIIAWLPHGRSWRILQQKAFEERVIPLYFRHGRYSSFTRQVNGWGFRRVTHGSDYNSYYHEMFLRGMPHLCDKLRRLTNKDTIPKRKKGEEEPSPDFYALSESFPLPAVAKAASFPLLAASATPGHANGCPADPAFFSHVDNALFEIRRANLLDRVLGSCDLYAGTLGFSALNKNMEGLNSPTNHNAFLQSALVGFDGTFATVGPISSPHARLQQQFLQLRSQGQHGMGQLCSQKRHGMGQFLTMNQAFGGMHKFGAGSNFYMNNYA